LNPSAILDVQRVKLLELVQEFFGCRRVMAVTFQLGDNLALPGDMPPSFGNMAFSLRKMV
jgi:hypothetical protein